MINSQPDITSEADIRLLVDGFYAKVVEDALLGPVFNGFAHVDWPRHLPVMYDFWSSLLLGTTRYHGRSATVKLLPSSGGRTTINLPSLFTLQPEGSVNATGPRVCSAFAAGEVCAASAAGVATTKAAAIRRL